MKQLLLSLMRKNAIIKTNKCIILYFFEFKNIYFFKINKVLEK